MMNTQVFIGIDPGGQGGIAILWNGLITYPMPDTEKDIWEAIDNINLLRHANIIELGISTTHCMIEAVHSMPGNAAQSMFKFGMNYGALRLALIAAGIPFESVRPEVWQKGMGIPSKRTTSSTKSEHKTYLYARAQELFPREKFRRDVADAVLLAEYCRRIRSSQ
jgi:hypothetical protein